MYTPLTTSLHLASRAFNVKHLQQGLGLMDNTERNQDKLEMKLDVYM